MPPYNIAPDVWFPNLGFYITRLPRYFIGHDAQASLIYAPWFPLPIMLYGLMIFLGVVMAYLMGIWWVRRSGQSVNDYTDLLLVGLIFAFIGLRLYFMIFNFDLYRGRNLIAAFFDIRGGGLAIYGGIIGAALAALFIARRKKMSFPLICDTGAPSMLLGQIIGRWGNFFNREAFGGYTDGPFAMRIPLGSSPQSREAVLQVREPYLLENLYTHAGVQYIQVHPTFFYEAALNLPLMIALIIYRPYKKFDGEIVLLYFLGYGVIRIFLEALRTDQLLFFGTGLAASQVVSALFIIASTTLLILGYRKQASSSGRK